MITEYVATSAEIQHSRELILKRLLEAEGQEQRDAKRRRGGNLRQAEKYFCQFSNECTWKQKAINDIREPFIP